MRKLFLNLTVAMTIASSAIPVTACAFNFYVESSIVKIKKFLASETSNIVKSLVLSNQIHSETQQTINDMFSNHAQNNITNQNATTDKNKPKQIDTWNDFSKFWGQDGKIKIDGFDEDKFIVAKGQSALSNKVTSNDKFNSTSDAILSKVNILTLINNQMVYSNLISPNAAFKTKIMQYLKLLQSPDKLPPSIAKYWSLISKLINNFQDNLLMPITNFLTDLVDGWKTAPSDNAGLNDYMQQWKDNNQPYSQWVNQDGNWTLNPSYTKKWSSSDYGLYRGGTILNYLFKKIGTDNSDQVASQYLGEILSSNIKNPELALKPYLSLLPTNPRYILMLLTSILPVMKNTILQMNNVNNGVKALTIGSKYPSNKNLQRWNLLDVFNQIKTLISNRSNLEKTIDTLLDSPFLYDVKINYFITRPLPKIFAIPWIGKTIKQKIIKAVSDLLSSKQFTDIFDNIYNLINKLNNQYANGGINLNLVALKELLVANKGLLNQLNIFSVTLARIIKPGHEIDDEDLKLLYTTLGGIIPKKNYYPTDFKTNSFLALLKKQFTENNSVLVNLLTLLYDKNQKCKGIIQLIIDQNKKWNDENYLKYLDTANSNSTFSNINFKQYSTSKFNIINLSYQVTFKIKNVNFIFWISGQAQDNKHTYRGTHNFKFNEIDLVN